MRGSLDIACFCFWVDNSVNALPALLSREAYAQDVESTESTSNKSDEEGTAHFGSGYEGRKMNSKNSETILMSSDRNQ